MAEDHPVVDPEQPVRPTRESRLRGHAESFGRPPHQGRVADRLGRRDQQQPPGLRGQLRDPGQEALLDPAGQRLGVQQAEATRQPGRGQPARQLQQGERIAPGLRHDPSADAPIESRVRDGVQQGVGVGIAQPGDLELRQPEQLRTPLAGAEENGDRLGQQPPGDEAQHLSRGLVQPLRVVDHAEQRAFLRHVRQQTEQGQADQETIRRGSGPHPEHRLERRSLCCGKRRQPLEQRRAQLMQGGERQLHLGLHADRAEHPHPGRRALRVPQQRRLPDAGTAAHHQHPARTSANGGDHLVEGGALRLPSEQPRACFVRGALALFCHRVAPLSRAAPPSRVEDPRLEPARPPGPGVTPLSFRAQPTRIRSQRPRSSVPPAWRRDRSSSARVVSRASAEVCTCWGASRSAINR